LHLHKVGGSPKAIAGTTSVLFKAVRGRRLMRNWIWFRRPCHSDWQRGVNCLMRFLSFNCRSLKCSSYAINWHPKKFLSLSLRFSILRSGIRSRPLIINSLLAFVSGRYLFQPVTLLRLESRLLHIFYFTRFQLKRDLKVVTCFGAAPRANHCCLFFTKRAIPVYATLYTVSIPK
jgi:hypothetical protein